MTALKDLGPGTKAISILIPSRKRSERLLKTIRSLEAVTKDFAAVEILIRADDDDEQTLELVDSLWSPFDIRLYHGPRKPKGYIQIHEMYEELVQISLGNLLFIFNDDAEILTHGWDTIVRRFEHKPAIYHVGDGAKESEFPIIHRTIPTLTENFGRHCSIDRWFYMIGNAIRKNVRINGIQIHHDRSLGLEHDKDGLPSWNPTDVYYLTNELDEDVKKLAPITKKLVSFLIPTRNRPHGANKAAESILRTASNPNNVEILFWIDSDDHKSIAWADAVAHIPHISCFGGERVPGGYENLHQYYNLLYEQANGEFLFIFNDDTVMVNEGWDKVLEKYSGQAVMLDPRWNHNSQLTTFPIVSRQLPERMEVFCEHVYIDRWFHYIAEEAGCYVSARTDDNLIWVDHLGDTDRRAHGDNGEFPTLATPFVPPPLDPSRIHQLAEKIRNVHPSL